MSKTDSSESEDDWMLVSPASDPVEYIDSYRVLDKLGSGGMGDVFRVYDEKLDRPIALKVIRPTPFSNADVRGVRESGVLGAES